MENRLSWNSLIWWRINRKVTCNTPKSLWLQLHGNNPLVIVRKVWFQGDDYFYSECDAVSLQDVVGQVQNWCRTSDPWATEGRGRLQLWLWVEPWILQSLCHLGRRKTKGAPSLLTGWKTGDKGSAFTQSIFYHLISCKHCAAYSLT